MGNKKCFLGALACFITVLINIIILSETSLAVSKESLTKKALLNGLKTCATTEYFKAPIDLNDYKDLSNANLKKLFTSAGKKVGNNTVKVPNMVGNTIKDGGVSCLQVLQGYHMDKYDINGEQNIKGLAEYSGKAVSQDKLASMGYRDTVNKDAKTLTQQCVQITYREKVMKLFGGETWKDRETSKYCFWVADDVIEITPKGDHNVQKTKPGSGKNGIVKLDAKYDSNSGYWINTYYTDTSNKVHSVLYTRAGQGDIKWSDFKNGFGNVASNLNKDDRIDGARVDFTTGSSTDRNVSNSDQTLTFGGASSKLAMLRYFAGSTATWDSIKFTDEEEIALKRAYVKDLIDAGKIKYGECNSLATWLEKNDNTELYVYQKDRTKDNYCVLEGADQITQKFNVPRTTHDLLYEDSFLQIVTSMMPQAIADKNYEIRHPEESQTTDPTDDSNDAINCYESAGALGYIICPVIQKAGYATQSIYETAIVDQLEFDSDGIISGNDSLRNSWSFFRDIANIIFVILLAAVLFSQFTGFGISNYGIKKILPRLIIMVILVNISFIICQLAVDVSNLLGHAFYDTFKYFSGDSDNLGRMIGDVLEGEGGLFSTVGSNTKTYHPSGAATVLSIAGVAIAVGTWDTWIIPLLIAIIGFIVSVVFFAILLSVRQAGIIVLIALTPVAVVCYSLPNTKTIFDKWFKLFSSLLMVFPIAGLLMGGGIWASNLMLDTGGGRSDAGLGGFFFALTAMLLQVIPFFFVPTLVKNSLAAAGQLGAKIAGMGDRLGSSLQKTARNSNRVKDTQERMSGWRANRRVNPWYNGDGRIANSALGRGRRAIAGVGDRVRGGNNRVSRMLNNSHNRRMNRLAASALAADLNSRDRTSAYAEKHVQEIAKDFSGRWKNEGRLDVDSLGEELESAITDLSKDSTDINAKGRYMAAMTELTKAGGPGRNKVGQSLLNAVGENGPHANRGIQWAYNTLLGESGDLYKRKDSYTFTNAQQFSKAGDFDMTGMVKENGNWVNKNNLIKNLDDISGQRIADLDKSELDRIVEMSQHAVGEKDEDGNLIGFRDEEMRNKFISAAMSANTNPNITVDADKADRIDKIANANYIAANSGNDSASTVSLANIKSMANSSQAALDSQLTSIQNGTITGNDLTRLANVAEATLNDANAGRSNITQETADKLNRIRAADGRTAIAYTRAEINIPHGGNNSDI